MSSNITTIVHVQSSILIDFVWSPCGNTWSVSTVKMKLARKLLYLVEVFLMAAIMCFVYTLCRGSERSNNEAVWGRQMPRVMQLGTAGKCENRACLELLAEEEKIQYDTCYNKSVSAKYVEKFGPISAGTCHFQNGGSRFPVGLGSFQGSGNTWLRGLLQKVTGICTGNGGETLLTMSALESACMSLTALDVASTIEFKKKKCGACLLQRSMRH